MRVRTTDPKGMAPSVGATILSESAAQLALDGVVEPGRFRPLREPVQVAQPSKAGTVLGLFKLGNTWLNWLYRVSVCRSPLANDQWKRLYFAGGDAFAPQYTTEVLALSGNDWPGVTYRLGVPAPVLIPGAVVIGDPTDDDPTLADTRYYVETYVSAYGEEGPPGPVSVEVVVAPGQTVQLSGLSSVPAGNYNITHRRIYRTNVGSSGAEFQLVLPSTYPDGLIPLAVAEVVDDCSSGALGGVMASADYDLPPEDLHSMIVLPCGALAGLSGNQICFTPPYQPHAWPVKYRMSFDFDGVALGAYGNYILVATTGAPYVVVGTNPESMSSPEKAEDGYGCVSARGMVDMGYSLVYPAVDGLRYAGLSGVRNLTADMITEKDWQALKPETIHAYLWDGKYVGFWDNTNTAGTHGFIFDPATGNLTYHNISATAGFNDPLTGDLYVLTAAGICLWDDGVARPATWKGKKFELQDSYPLTVARVFADGYPLTFSIWSNGRLKRQRTVVTSEPFKLPPGETKQLEYQVSGPYTWQMVAVATSERELLG